MSESERTSLRKALCQTQGYLCAFCMQRIQPVAFLPPHGGAELPRKGMKIAHFVPQHVADEGPEERDGSLDWTNLLGACPGGEDRPNAAEREPRFQHCDSRQGNQRLHPLLNPATNPTIEAHVQYLPSGRIIAVHPDPDVQSRLQDDLGRTMSDDRMDRGGRLNLNLQRLVENRAAVLDELKRALPAGRWKRQHLEQLIHRWASPDQDGYLPQYNQFAIFMLRRWVKKLG